jgi:hypothetical protein
MLVTQNPSKWNEYLDLHQYIYTNLKSSYPSLILFSSIQGSYILDGQIASVDYSAQHQALTALLPYEDIFAISIYPYATDIGTAGIPQDLFDKLKTFSAGKPMAIAETGYIAQSLSLTSPVAFFPSDAVKQNNYISFILQQAEMYRFLFVNNFILRDYDKLWQQSGGIADISALWRDTGLYDENGNERPALSTWKEWLKKTYAR